MDGLQSRPLVQGDLNVGLAIRSWARAILAGIAQLVFCSMPAPGLFVALGLLAFSPWMLLGGLLGAAIGTVIERRGTGLDYRLWREGVGGFNAATLGILGCGFFAAWDERAIIVIGLLVVCTLIGVAMRKLMVRAGLFPLSAPAYLTAVVASVVLDGPGGWWWTGISPAPFGPAGVWIMQACLAAAMIWESPAAAGWSVCASLAFCILTTAFGVPAMDTISLWGLAIPLSAFGAQRLLAWRSPAAPRIAMEAAVLSAIVWWLWRLLGLDRIAPPLIAPTFIGLWAMLYLYGRRWRRPARAAIPHPLLQRAFTLALWELWRSRWRGEAIVLVTGPSQAEDDILGGLFGDDADVRGSMLETRSGRRRLWEASDLLRSAEKPPAADFDADLVVAGDCTGGTGEARRYEGAGRADRIRCLSCGLVAAAPPVGLWRRLELHCSQCAGHVVPDIRRLAPLEPATAAAELQAAWPDRAISLVLPGALRGPAAGALLRKFRQGNGRVVQLLDQPGEALAGALVVVGRPNLTLRLFRLLGGGGRRP